MFNAGITVRFPPDSRIGGKSMIRTGKMFALLATAALVAAVFVPALAAQSKSQGAAVSETVTIVAIDATNRIVTVKDKSGEVDSIYAGPDVQRFSELKVGDKVTFKYYESMVYQIRKPGATPPAAATGDAGIVRSTGSKPGATISKQMTATVTVTAIDMKVPSVTIMTEDGSINSFKVEDKKSLDGVKVGDQVEITYTQALAISVK
jgi:Cu/Ag efflux protein CusF